MRETRGPDIVYRWEGNPIIEIEDLGFRVTDICNAGAVKVGDEYILLVTIQTLEGFHSIHTARSPDGYSFTISDRPLMAACQPKSKDKSPEDVYYEHGVMDPRITQLDGQYYIVFDAVGRHGYRLGLARTDDFESVDKLGLISLPDTKGGALFPKKIKGKYARLERPWERSSIWVSYSDDLQYWGSSQIVLTPRGGYWDMTRVGTATPPMEIGMGWLIVYYGIKGTSAGPLFRLGAAILDKEDPSQVLGRTNVPILSPRNNLERLGDVPNLVFSCGAIIEPDNEVKLYYGAANSCLCLGITSVQELVDACMESAKEF